MGAREKVVLGRATRAESVCGNVPLGNTGKARGKKVSIQFDGSLWAKVNRGGFLLFGAAN